MVHPDPCAHAPCGLQQQPWRGSDGHRPTWGTSVAYLSPEGALLSCEQEQRSDAQCGGQTPGCFPLSPWAAPASCLPPELTYSLSCVVGPGLWGPSVHPGLPYPCSEGPPWPPEQLLSCLRGGSVAQALQACRPHACPHQDMWPAGCVPHRQESWSSFLLSPAWASRHPPLPPKKMGRELSGQGALPACIWLCAPSSASGKQGEVVCHPRTASLR